jgi:hypothetical protein
MSLAWIAAIALISLILLLFIVPAMDVRISRRVANPMVIAALLLALSLAISNSIGYADDLDAQQTLGVISGVLVAAGLFVLALAAARFAGGDDVATIRSMTPTRTVE